MCRDPPLLRQTPPSRLRRFTPETGTSRRVALQNGSGSLHNDEASLHNVRASLQNDAGSLHNGLRFGGTTSPLLASID